MRVTPQVKHRARFLAGVALLSPALVALYLWAFSKPRTPLAYMVAGTLETVILLTAAFVEIVKRGYLGQPRHARRGRSRAVRVSNRPGAGTSGGAGASGASKITWSEKGDLTERREGAEWPREHPAEED